MRHRRYIKPVIPSDGKVSIWSENGGSQERIEVAELVGKLILLHHSNGGAPMRVILQVTPKNMELIAKIIYSCKLQVEILPKPYRF